MYRGTLEEGGIGLWGMQSGVEVFVVWMERGTPEEGGIGPGVDVDEGRQRKVASVRAGTPSGDTTRTP